MFMKKVYVGSAIGAVLGMMAMFGSTDDSETIGQKLAYIPTAMVFMIILTFWWTRDMGSDGNFPQQSSYDTDTKQLQNDLELAIYYITFNERNGNLQQAAIWRGKAAVIESKLRSRGA